jgi:lipoprotein-anchoring transpeptidase ErfK/SrfK
MATPMTTPVLERRALFAALPPEDRPETGPAKSLPPQFQRTQVDYPSREPLGTIVVDTPHTYLYLVLGNGKAMRYGIGVGREGFTWSGSEKGTKSGRMARLASAGREYRAPAHLPRFMAGGEGNPLVPARFIWARRSTASTARTSRRPSAARVIGLHPPDQ